MILSRGVVTWFGLGVSVRWADYWRIAQAQAQGLITAGEVEELFIAWRVRE